jgi:hypothetical protein
MHAVWELVSFGKINVTASLSHLLVKIKVAVKADQLKYNGEKDFIS